MRYINRIFKVLDEVDFSNSYTNQVRVSENNSFEASELPISLHLLANTTKRTYSDRF